MDMATSREAPLPEESAGQPAGNGADGTTSVSLLPAGSGLPRMTGGRVALMAPMTPSLALRADHLEPGDEAAVGCVLGISAD